MLNSSLKVALNAIKASKIRSLLTMVGVIIGVMSVVLIISLGEGIKKEVRDSIDKTGSDVVELTTGASVIRNEEAEIVDFNSNAVDAGPQFSAAQFEALGKIEGIELISGSTIINKASTISQGDESIDNVLLVAATDNYTQTSANKVSTGEFYAEDSTQSAVLGNTAAIDLFKNDSPLTRTFTVKGKELAVIGVMEEYSTTSTFLPDYNNAVFIPHEMGRNIAGLSLGFDRIRVKVKDVDNLEPTLSEISEKLNELRSDTDFSYVKADEAELVAVRTLSNITKFITAIAVVSLFVGGIGVMNIMIAVVSERSYEIGIRKSIGAPNSSILQQFLIEAVVLSLIGAILGILAAFIVGFFVSSSTDLSFDYSIKVIALAILISAVLGVMFGLAPAVKASRKDAIFALRGGNK